MRANLNPSLRCIISKQSASDSIEESEEKSEEKSEDRPVEVEPDISCSIRL